MNYFTWFYALVRDLVSSFNTTLRNCVK